MNDAEFFAELLEHRELFVMLKELRDKQLDIIIKYDSAMGLPNAKNRYSCQLIGPPTTANPHTARNWETTWRSDTLVEAVRRSYQDAKHEGLLG